jgi:predicted DNA binding CopG/RHH family protein
MKEIKITAIKESNLTPKEEAEFDKIIEEAEKELEAKSKPVTLRLSVSEIERCKKIAAKKGLPYQTYIKSILKQALDKEVA